MYVRGEFNDNPNGLPELVLYGAAVADGVIELTDGALLAAWSYEGPDMDSMAVAETWGRCDTLSGFLNLGSDWMVETDACRRPVTEYMPESAVDNPVAAVIDHERRRQFLTPDHHFRSQYFLTLTHRPSSQKVQRMASWFTGHKPEKTSAAETERLARLRLENFQRAIGDFEVGFKTIFSATRLRRQPGDDQLLRFLRECVLGEDFPFAPPLSPMYLMDRFGADLITGEPPWLNGSPVSVIAIDRYPVSDENEQRGSRPGILRALEMLPFSYRWHTRSALLDPEASVKLHLKHQRAWRSVRMGLVRQLTGFGSNVANPHALEMEAAAGQAVTMASRGLVQFGHYNAKVVLHSDSKDDINLALDSFKRSGFTPRLETVNAMDAWRGTWPGHGYSDLRVVPVHTRHYAHMMPQSTMWTGDLYNSSPIMPPQTPPVFLAATDGNTPYRFHAHVGENSHACIFGPTRYGKSTLLAFLVAQWIHRNPTGQAFCFDKKASIKTLITALGGHFFEFGEGPQFCPLENLDTDHDRAWCTWYIAALCENNGLRITAEHRIRISETVKETAGSRRRSLSEFSARTRHQELQNALAMYTVASEAMGGILDAESDGLSLGAKSPLIAHRVFGFELERLMTGDKRILKAVLPYLFHRLNSRLDTRRPTLIPVDEAWTALQDSVFAEYLRNWLKDLAKQNAGVLLATQDLADVMDSPLKDIIINQCATKIFLPTSAAETSQRQNFLDMSLTPEQISAIARGRGKQDYFHFVNQSPTVFFRRFQLNLGKVALAFVGSNSDDDREMIARLQKAHPSEWQERWLRHKGLPDWADKLRQLSEENNRYACA